MAFNKGSLGRNQNVKEYTDGLEGRIDSAFKESVEKSTNSNGTYWKFESGLLVCMKEIRRSEEFGSWGSVWISKFPVWDFPHRFSTPPSVSFTPRAGGLTGWTNIGNTTNAQNYNSSWVRPVATDKNSELYTVVAVGSWK